MSVSFLFSLAIVSVPPTHARVSYLRQFCWPLATGRQTWHLHLQVLQKIHVPLKIFRPETNQPKTCSSHDQMAQTQQYGHHRTTPKMAMGKPIMFAEIKSRSKSYMRYCYKLDYFLNMLLQYLNVKNWIWKLAPSVPIRQVIVKEGKNMRVGQY